MKDKIKLNILYLKIDKIKSNYCVLASVLHKIGQYSLNKTTIK